MTAGARIATLAVARPCASKIEKLQGAANRRPTRFDAEASRVQPVEQTRHVQVSGSGWRNFALLDQVPHQGQAGGEGGELKVEFDRALAYVGCRTPAELHRGIVDLPDTDWWPRN